MTDIQKMFVEEATKEGIQNESNINKNLFYDTLFKEFEQVVEENRKKTEQNKNIKRNKDIYDIRKGKEDSYFEAARYTVPGLKYEDGKVYSKTYQTLLASYNAARNFQYRIGRTKKDNLTSLTYQALMKLLLTYRFLEIFRKFIYEIEGIEADIDKGQGIYLNSSEGLFKEFLEEVEKIDLIKIKEANFPLLQKLDKSQDRGFNPEQKYPYFIFKLDNGKEVFNTRSKNLQVINEIRHLFVHSKLSANTGGQPYSLFILSNVFSNIYLEKGNEFFNKKVVNKLFYS